MTSCTRWWWRRVATRPARCCQWPVPTAMGRPACLGSRLVDVSARLARDTNCSPSSAAVALRRARQQAQLPATVAAIARGELSLDHLDLLGRANNRSEPSCSPATSRCWSRRAPGCGSPPPSAPSGTGASEPTTTWVRIQHRPVKPTTVRSGRRPRSTGRSWCMAPSTPSAARSFTTELKVLERQQRLADQRRGVTRTPAERRAAALVEMAVRSATCPAGGRRPQPLFTVLLGEVSFQHLCELANGTVIQPAQLAPWLGTAELETILFDGPLTVLGVSRRRSFTGALRRAIEVRDRHRQHPVGCDVPRRTATWTTSSPTAVAGRPASSTGASSAHPTTAGATSTTTTPRPTPNGPSPGSMSSEPGSDGASKSTTPSALTTPPTTACSADQHSGLVLCPGPTCRGHRPAATRCSDR